MSIRTRAARLDVSRNKVAVGEPAAGLVMKKI